MFSSKSRLLQHCAIGVMDIMQRQTSSERNLSEHGPPRTCGAARETVIEAEDRRTVMISRMMPMQSTKSTSWLPWHKKWAEDGNAPQDNRFGGEAVSTMRHEVPADMPTTKTLTFAQRTRKFVPGSSLPAMPCNKQVLIRGSTITYEHKVEPLGRMLVEVWW